MRGLDVIESLYLPLGWRLTNIVEETQNQEYGGYRLQLNQVDIRFRIAKITPKKIGQFVAFWEKIEGVNRPYSYGESPDLLVIYTEENAHKGHFVFPKATLKERGILSTEEKVGKMGIRIYPPWDQPTSLQGKATQQWQLAYFTTNGEEMARLYQK